MPPNILPFIPNMAQIYVHQLYSTFICELYDIFSGPPQTIGAHPFPGNCDCCFFAIKINQWTAQLDNINSGPSPSSVHLPYMSNRIMARIMWFQKMWQEGRCRCGGHQTHPYSNAICPYPYHMSGNVAVPGTTYSFPPSPYGYWSPQYP